MTASNSVLQCGSYLLPLNRPHVMGILNLTPDSFSDGGQLFSANTTYIEAVCRRAEAMLEAGASLLDLGGESTRPGATPVSSNEEIDRVMPAVEALRCYDIPLSIDTSSPALMTLALDAGAALINDVRALSRPGALQAVAASSAAVCLMHMQGQPATMQKQPLYSNVTEEVTDFFQVRVQACISAGIDSQRILLDPGFGFGKTLQQNLQLFKSMNKISSNSWPLLVGVSRKSMIGAILGKEDPCQRIVGGAMLAGFAIQQGASVIRTHDVSETIDAVRIAQALMEIDE